MDDVGQTLLNWASAFGTQEMVEFLCAKGADVNKGKNRYFPKGILIFRKRKFLKMPIFPISIFYAGIFLIFMIPLYVPRGLK